MTSPLSAELATRVIQQAFQYWFEPEITRRQTAGSLPVPAKIWAAQILLTPAEQPRVLLNEELRGVLRARPAPGQPLPAKGSIVSFATIDSIEGIQLTDAEPNAGHLTVIFRPDGHFLAFDFRYNAARIAAVLERASEFLAAARSAHRRNHSSSFVENLYAATELLATSIVLQLPGKAMLSKPSHGYVHTTFNWFGQRNVPGPFVKLLNQLSAMRPKARYGLLAWHLRPDERRRLLRQCSAFRRHVDQRRPRRHTT